MLKVYQYEKCSTCRKALKLMDEAGIKYQSLSIVDTPPSAKELRQMLKHIKVRGGSIKNLFNTSGIQYRELKIADRLKAGLTEAEAVELLAQNGKLVKRPFILGKDDGLVGMPQGRGVPVLLAMSLVRD